MSRILLVRHGQASWGKEDYDDLSALGERQARVVGRALAARHVDPQLVVAGGLRRQQQTAATMYAAAGWAGVDIGRDDGWDEYDHQAIIAAHTPAYRSVAVMEAELARAADPRRTFEELFQAAMTRWVGGQHDDDYAEPFATFATRVEAALAALLERLAPDCSAVVASSAGPISWTLTRTLQGDPLLWGRLQRVMINASVSSINIGRTGHAVTSFNDYSHLEVAGSDLVTNR